MVAQAVKPAEVGCENGLLTQFGRLFRAMPWLLFERRVINVERRCCFHERQTAFSSPRGLKIFCPKIFYEVILPVSALFRRNGALIVSCLFGEFAFYAFKLHLLLVWQT